MLEDLFVRRQLMYICDFRDYIINVDSRKVSKISSRNKTSKIYNIPLGKYN